MRSILGKIKDVLRSRVAQNAGWLVVGDVIRMLINLIVGLLTARYLGPSNYGLINYASAYTAFFSSVCTLGINSVIVKELIENPGKDGTVIGTSLGLRAISSLLSAVTISCISIVVDADESVTQLVVFLSSIGMIFQIFEIFKYWFQSKLQSKMTAIATLAAYVITSVYKVILLILQKSVIYFAFATSVDYICLAALLYYFYKRGGGRRLSFSWGYGKTLLKKSYHYIFSGLMVAVYGQTDKIMLKHMVNDAELGYYSTASSLCHVWCFILSAIITSMYPIIVEAYKRSKEDFDKKNKLLYAIVFYMSTIVSLGFTVLGDVIIKILYGAAYAPAAEPLRIITWYTAFSYLGVARDAWIVCMDKQKYLKYIYVTSAVVNVVLNLIFIPFMGASGAALASLIAQISTIVVPFFIKDMRENSALMVKAILFK